ncbi:MAG: VOC family protein [Mycobacteriales bacterium]
MGTGEFHHVELWVADLPLARASWDWLLRELGYADYQDWPAGHSWRLKATYIVLEQSPDIAGQYDRTRAGLNHLAFHAGSRDDVDRLVAAAPGNGWSLMYADRHPYAGGPEHYAAYLENSHGFEVELVAST